MRSGKFLGFLGFMMLLLTACDVHQWPVPNDEPQPGPEVPTLKNVNLNISLEYLTEMKYWEHTYDGKTGKITDTSSDDSDTYDNLDNILPGSLLEVTVKVHKDNSNRTLVSSDSFITKLAENFDSEVDIELPAGGDYIITVWSHLLDDNGEALYDHSDFNSIRLIKEKYSGNNDMRDAFRGRTYISVSGEENLEEKVTMKRPMGKMEFITTGLQEFFAAEEKRLKDTTRAVSPDDYTVLISYPYYYPYSFTAMDDRNEDALPGFGFYAPLTLTRAGDDETSLGFDYVFINDIDNGAVQVQVSLIHTDGTTVSSTGTLTVPVKRSRHTVLKGDFLQSSSNGGGIGIDPDFEGDFNIPM